MDGAPPHLNAKLLHFDRFHDTLAFLININNRNITAKTFSQGSTFFAIKSSRPSI
jgi:hypothetical protein